jgi:thiamine biosynthesis lipoprotein
VTVNGVEAHAADALSAGLFAEIERLQGVFNGFDEHSELSRWRRGETVPGPELSEVIASAIAWRRRTRAAFSPAVGGLLDLWDTAQANGKRPTEQQIARVLGESGQESVESWNLNGIAKGWIVDRAARKAFASVPALGLVVNAGGDLLSLGQTPTVVGIENPRRPFDNVPPLARVAVKDAALATSGTTRRGWRIAGEWCGHVIDPRSGRPVSHIESASVIAPDAATADVLATSFTVLAVAEGIALADQFGVACLLLDADGRAHRNNAWRYTELDTPLSSPPHTVNDKTSNLELSNAN